MRRIFPVYRNEAGDSAAFESNRELPDPETGRGMDVAYDLYDADTGDLVKRGMTPRQERETAPPNPELLPLTEGEQ